MATRVLATLVWLGVLLLLRRPPARAALPDSHADGSPAVLDLGQPEILASWHLPAVASALAESREGRLWIATATALLCFDGHRFAPVATPFAPSRVSALLGDQGEGLWIGLADPAAIVRFSQGTFREIAADATLPVTVGKRVTQFVQAGAETVWFGVDTAIGWAGSREGMVKTWPLPPSQRSPVTALTMGQDGDLWVGTAGGISVFRHGRFAFYRGGVVASIVRDADKQIWIAHLDVGLQKARRNLPGFMVYPSGLPFTAPNALAFGRDLFVADRKAGLNLVKGDRIVRIDRHRFGDDPVHALEAAGDGDVWGVTRKGTLFRVGVPAVRLLDHTRGLPPGPIQALYEDDVNGVYVAGEDELLRLQVASASGRYTVSHRVAVPCVRGISGFGPHGLWIATCAHGLFRSGPGHVLDPQPIEDFPERELATVFTARDGTAWVAPLSGGLWSLAGEQLKRVGGVFHHVTGGRCASGHGECEHTVTAIAETGAGELLVATRGRGLFRHSGRGWAPVLEVPSRALLSLHVDSVGTIWIGTQDLGLIRGDGHTFVRLGSDGSGLPSPISSITEDEDGRLWLVSDDGLYQVSKLELARALEAGAPIDISRFDARDGLTQWHVTDRHAARRLKDGSLWFAHGTGLAVLSPESLARFVTPIVPSVDGISVGGAPQLPGHTASLSSSAAELRVAISAPVFIAPHGVRYRHRLSGHGGDWESLDAPHELRLAGVATGDHTLEIEAWRAGFPETVGRVSLPVRVAPLTEQPRFYALLMTFVAVIGLLIAHGRRRRDRERFALILDERRRVARDLHDSLAHSFTSIGFQIDHLRSLLPDASANVHQVLDDSKAMLQYGRRESRRSIWNIRSQCLDAGSLPAGLRALANEACGVSGKRVEFEQRGSLRSCQPIVAEGLLRIAQEALINAMLHGRADEILLLLEIERGSVQLTIEDDGIGFESIAARADNPVHFGIDSMRERANALGAALTVESEAGSGTRVRVQLPLTATRGSAPGFWPRWLSLPKEDPQ